VIASSATSLSVISEAPRGAPHRIFGMSDVARIFSAIEEIRQNHAEFLTRIRERFPGDNWSPSACIGDVFSASMALFTPHMRFVADFTEGSSLLTRFSMREWVCGVRAVGV
jgi:hypothetical protein